MQIMVILQVESHANIHGNGSLSPTSNFFINYHYHSIFLSKNISKCCGAKNVYGWTIQPQIGALYKFRLNVFTLCVICCITIWTVSVLPQGNGSVLGDYICSSV